MAFRSLSVPKDDILACVVSTKSGMIAACGRSCDIFSIFDYFGSCTAYGDNSHLETVEEYSAHSWAVVQPPYDCCRRSICRIWGNELARRTDEVLGAPIIYSNVILSMELGWYELQGRGAQLEGA